jgi:hypothetical protein
MAPYLLIYLLTQAAAILGKVEYCITMFKIGVWEGQLMSHENPTDKPVNLSNGLNPHVFWKA